LLVADLYVRPSGAVAGEHLHPTIEESFTVVSGRVAFSIDGREATARPGERLRVPAGVAHDWWNAGEEEAHIKVEISPGSRFEGMIKNLWGLARDGKTNSRGMPNLLQGVLFAREFEDVSQAGAERLRILNRAKWPTTLRLLSAAGLRAGMRVLDVGCGSGAVTLEMAALVGAEGEGVGIDCDSEILELARGEAENLNVALTLRHVSAEELDKVAAYDFAYARYLLSHLCQPELAFVAMVRALRPGGRLVVEDVYFPGHLCYPPNAAIDSYVGLYQAAARTKGADPAIGPRLVGMALEVGLVDVRIELVVPVFRDGEGKRVAQATMEHLRESVIDAGLATGAEVDSIVAELEAFAEDERTLMSLAPTFQLWGRKAAA
jgi:ubiquinone/menaquinone biosynthesis C-methylase UbiE